MLIAGTVIDQWKIIEALSPGGMGAVYRVQHVRLGKRGALKVPLPGADKVRFEREWQLLDQLKHPHIVPIEDAGHSPMVSGSYFVTRWLPLTLEEKLDADGQLDPVTVARLANQLGSALDAAHTAGVVHRDVKPSNILLDDDGSAFLGDFGVAHLNAATRLTLTGSQLGTAPYMSPEQINGQPISGASDQYALACVIYEALVGRPPFDGSTLQEVWSGHLFREADPPSDLAAVPPEVDAIFERALAKEPADRYPSAAELATALTSTIGAYSGVESSTVPPRFKIGTTYVGGEWDRLVRELEAESPRGTDFPPGPFLVVTESWRDTLEESVAEFAAAQEGWHRDGSTSPKRRTSMPEKVTIFGVDHTPLAVTLRPGQPLWSRANLELIQLAAGPGASWVRGVSRTIWIPSGGYGSGQLASRDYVFPDESDGVPIDVVLLERDARTVGGLTKRGRLAQFPEYGSRWAEQDLARLDELMLSGTPFVEIVAELGRTPRAILSTLAEGDEA